VNEAALLAGTRNKSAVEMEDFEEAINRLIADWKETPGNEPKRTGSHCLP